MSLSFHRLLPYLQSLCLFLLTLSTLLFILIYHRTAPHANILYGHSPSNLTLPTLTTNSTRSTRLSPYRYLSYQPPGNGWNNQRIAFEHAVIFSRLLNRTLLVPPMAPHLPGRRYTGQAPNGSYTGYKVYNELPADMLIPMDSIVDFKLLSRLVQVRANAGRHVEFLGALRDLLWRRVCHSPGYGIWVDRAPVSAEEKGVVAAQSFNQKADWMNKCEGEKERFEGGEKLPFVRFLLDEFWNATEDLIYFEEGTLFAVDFRFLSLEDTATAQRWISDYIRYHPQILRVGQSVAAHLRSEYGGGYNAVHVRRNDRFLRYGPELWLDRVRNEFSIPKSKLLYISTDEENLTFFKTFKDSGYSLMFREDIPQLFSLQGTGVSRRDVAGMSEQIVCSLADQFVPSQRSTFSTLIRRMRNELSRRDGVFVQGYYFVWANHFVLETNRQN